MNPGPHYQSNFFNFMSWNLNALAKDNFQRVRLIEAHHSIFNYDVIAFCETSLNDSVDVPEILLNDYTFVSANNPTNSRHNGVGLFYKTSLPVIVLNDLSFNESIVLELNFGRKKLFFTENLHSRIKTENPLAMFFTGDFNAHSQFWGHTTDEGTNIEELFTNLGLSQLISEPTHFEAHRNPLCIDLLVTDQPNIILDSGTRASLDSYCHHQIIYCKVNFKILPPLPFERKIWHYNRADLAAIKRSMTNFP